jgi:hypothetical protein
LYVINLLRFINKIVTPPCRDKLHILSLLSTQQVPTSLFEP